MRNNYDAFEKFLSDGGTNCPDTYLLNEPEDFSPTGSFNVAFINSYSKDTGHKFALDLIA